MKKAFLFLANGFEEVEAITPIDYLRRAGINLVTVGVQGKSIVSSRKVSILCDIVLDEVDAEDCFMAILPGGLPNSETLANSEGVKAVVEKTLEKGGIVAAICAAPWALSKAGVLKDRYVCYPGFENQVNHKGYDANSNVVIDKNIITSRGPATAMEFALALVKELVGEAKYQEVKDGLLFN